MSVPTLKFTKKKNIYSHMIFNLFIKISQYEQQIKEN